MAPGLKAYAGKLNKFTDDTKYIEHEIQTAGPGTLMFALVPEHMTGKIVNES